MRIRPETPADESTIDDVIRSAFLSAPHTSHTEHLIVKALRAARQLSVSLVAEDKGWIIGYVAVSPVDISDGTQSWYGLGPVVVLPAFQGRRVGTQLIREALKALQDAGAAGCVVLGEPGYYSRFGFGEVSGLTLPGVSKEYFLARAFAGPLPVGQVSYHATFSQ